MTKRLAVGEDEWYPVYSLTDDVNDFVWKYHLSEFIELTESEFEEYKKVCKEFDKWQEKIKERLPND
jgi:hypothetical protein